MAITINGVPCEELVRDFGEAIDDRGPSARKGYLCAWSNRYTLANGLLGLPTSAGGVGGSVTLPTPSPYQESSNLFARTISIEGKGTPFAGARQVAYPYAAVWVDYGVLPFGVPNYPDLSNGIDPATPFVYASQDLDFSLDQVSIPASAAQLGADPVTKDIISTFPRAELSITLHAIPYLPAQQIFNFVGKLNNAIFLGGAAGRVRFNGAKNKRTFSSDGGRTQEVSYSFSYRTVAPWDYIIHPNGTAGWVQYKDKNGDPYIPRVDLSQVFPVGYLY